MAVMLASRNDAGAAELATASLGPLLTSVSRRGNRTQVVMSDVGVCACISLGSCGTACLGESHPAFDHSIINLQLPCGEARANQPQAITTWTRLTVSCFC